MLRSQGCTRATIQYFCNYWLALENSLKFLSCLGLFGQYEKYYCLVLKFFIILELRRRATKSEPNDLKTF